MKKFKKELETLINKHSIENECDLPDFILAEMIVNFIKAVGTPIKEIKGLPLDGRGMSQMRSSFINFIVNYKEEIK